MPPVQSFRERKLLSPTLARATSGCWKTNSAGDYIAPTVPIGDYLVTAEAMGFQTFVRSGITLEVGRE